MHKKNSSSNPLVTISIVSHGDAPKISFLLESLRLCESPLQFQILLTDNLGDDVPEPIDITWQSFTILRNKKPLGFARNHNRAFQYARGKYFCILNPDILFEEEVFQSLIQGLENGQADIITPQIVDAGAVPQDSFRDFPTPFEIIRRRLPGYRFTAATAGSDGLVEPHWVAGIFMLLKNETYRKVGGFDEKFRLYFEDVDFCARARLLGMKIIVDTNIRVQHNADRASRKKARYLLWHMQSAVQYFISPVYRKVRKTVL